MLSVAGFKSISQEQTIEIQPLTLLSGANSSGKSSMLQPLLLLKQTLEAQYDPGPLLLNGPNAKFTSIRQFWPIHSSHGQTKHLLVAVTTSENRKTRLAFHWDNINKRLGVDNTNYSFDGSEFVLSEATSIKEVIRFLVDRIRNYPEAATRVEEQLQKSDMEIRRSRSFLEVVFDLKGVAPALTDSYSPRFSPRNSSPTASWKLFICLACEETPSEHILLRLWVRHFLARLRVMSQA